MGTGVEAKTGRLDLETGEARSGLLVRARAGGRRSPVYRRRMGWGGWAGLARFVRACGAVRPGSVEPGT